MDNVSKGFQTSWFLEIIHQYPLNQIPPLYQISRMHMNVYDQNVENTTEYL